MYQASDFQRLYDEVGNPEPDEVYRPPFWNDYIRLIHSPSFRRLQGKTQLYPSRENDFFRNRLTHSIEVAQIAKTIAQKINHEQKLELNTDLVEFSALSHDIGHPPFGHQGEEALDEAMRDFGGFEGNAQTLRILTRLEKKISPKGYPDIFFNGNDSRFGLNPTSRAIASVLKYNVPIPITNQARVEFAKGKTITPVKGFYASENPIVNIVIKNVLNGYNYTLTKDDEFKTLECSIMDISDDIAYSTFDLEDTLKANFLNPFDIMFPSQNVMKIISSRVTDIFNKGKSDKDEKIIINEDKVKETLLGIFSGIFDQLTIPRDEIITEESLNSIARSFVDMSYRTAKRLSNDGYFRGLFTSSLVQKFISGVEFVPHGKVPVLSGVKLVDDIKLQVEVLKVFNYEVNIKSPRLKMVEYRGKEIVKYIFDTLTRNERQGYMLMPNDFRTLYEFAFNKEAIQKRIVCDYIAGMTDAYCIEFFARLTSENPETIFKPM